MANDYRVVLSGEDRLSGTIKNIRNELNNTGKSGTKLDEIKRKFDRIQNSAAPLKSKLRSLRELMANMNLDGLSNTDVFGQMAEQAGQYADAIADAQQAVRAFADDNMKLQAVTDSFNLMTGAVGIATGAMGLLGVENERVEQAMLKVQSAIALMNGVQQVATLLNKDSVLMLRLKQIAIEANTASTVKNTAVEGASTVATKINTIAQTAWNVAKAVAKALLGDFSGLLLVGAGILATYAIATASATDEQEKNNEATEKAKTVQQEYMQNAAEQAGSLVGKYMELRTQWNMLRTDGEKLQFMKQQESTIKSLGGKVGDLNDLEDYFNKNTKNVVRALELRAKAMAAQGLIVEAYKNYYKKLNYNRTTVDGGGQKYIVHAGEDKLDIGKENYNGWAAWARKKYGANEDWTKYIKNLKWTEQGAASYNEYSNEKALERWEKNDKAAKAQLEKDTAFFIKEIEDANKQIASLDVDLDFNQPTGDGGKGRVKGNGNGNRRNEKPKTAEEIKRDKVKGITNDIKTALDDLSKGLFPEDEIRKRLEGLNKQLEALKLPTLPIDLAIKEVKVDKLKDRFSEISKQLADGLIDQNYFDKEVVEINKKLKELGAKEIPIKTKAEVKLDAINELENRAKDIQEYFDKGVMSLKEANDEITKLNKTAQTLGQKPIVLKIKTEMETKVEAAEEIHSQFSNINKQFELGLITENQLISKTNELNQTLSQLGAKPIELDIKTNFEKTVEQANETMEQIGAIFSAFDSIDGVVNSINSFSQSLREGANAWEIFMGAIQIGQSILSAVSGVFGAIQGVMDLFNITTAVGTTAQGAAATAATSKAAADTASVATTTAATVATKAQEAALLDLAAAAIFAAHASIPFAGVPIASGFITAMMAAMTAQKSASLALATFADGGVVSGNRFHGDSVLIRANAGETILTQKQSSDLFHMLKDTRQGDISGRVRFEISGDKLYGVLDNYNRKMNRIR